MGFILVKVGKCGSLSFSISKIQCLAQKIRVKRMKGSTRAC